MSNTATYKFAQGEVAYVTASARDGRMLGGPVSRIEIRIGQYGPGMPGIRYKVENNIIFAPPGGMFDESDLSTKAEAEAIVKAWSSRQAHFYEKMTDQLA